MSCRPKRRKLNQGFGMMRKTWGREQLREVLSAANLKLGLWLTLTVGALSTAVPLVVVAQIESTNSPEFCASCHEMEVFRETWENSTHGSGMNGTIGASCTDCHLPPAEDGIVSYLFAKGTSGLKDLLHHAMGRETDWLGKRDHRADFVYEAGCQKCHVNLESPGTSLKAFSAHRDFSTGEIKASCVDCHEGVGHGQLASVLKGGVQDQLAMTVERRQGHGPVLPRGDR